MGVTILMGTYNGMRFIEEQMSSIAAQGIRDLDLVVSDDGSSDGTRSHLQAWQEKWSLGQLEVREGPRRGFAENFRSLLSQTEPRQEFVALSDQDDVWDDDKLVSALAQLAPYGDVPALYCSRTRYVDEKGNFVGYSPHFRRPPGFANALVQSLAGGNTMVMNTRAFELLKTACARGPFVSHDWFAYMVIAGAGGQIVYDPVPHISYRQHGRNLVGANDGWMARLHRMGAIIKGGYKEWIDKNLGTLQANQELLLPAAKHTLAQFIRSREAGPISGLPEFFQARLYRQTWPSTLALWIAFIVKKL